ncbi:MAG TPA: hypothetical protein VFL46_06995 [Phycicoccus sp.]|nr:hypothetical protein [Phycicoccus sp.]
MGLLDRWRGRENEEATSSGSEPSGGTAPLEATEPVDTITSRRPTADEESVLDAARAHYAAHAIDPADLASIASAYERALDEAGEEGAAAEAVTVLATAVGDHLVTRGYRWVVTTDPFGTDLAVEPPRRPVPVVVSTLVAVRWMQRERGWLTGVVEHLARAGSR